MTTRVTYTRDRRWNKSQQNSKPPASITNSMHCNHTIRTSNSVKNAKFQINLILSQSSFYNPFFQQVVPLHLPLHQINLPSPKSNTKNKNPKNLDTTPTNRGPQLKVTVNVQKFNKFQNYFTWSQINLKIQNSTQVSTNICPTPKIIFQAQKQTTTPPHQLLHHPHPT